MYENRLLFFKCEIQKTNKSGLYRYFFLNKLNLKGTNLNPIFGPVAYFLEDQVFLPQIFRPISFLLLTSAPFKTRPKKMN